MERFRFFIEELQNNVDVWVLDAKECRDLMVDFSQFRDNQPDLCFKTYILDCLIDRFQEMVFPLVQKALGGGKDVDELLDSLFTMCLSVNPLLTIMSMDLLSDFIEPPDTTELDIDSEIEEKKSTCKTPRKDNRKKIHGMDKYLRKQIVGQQEAIERIYRSFKRAAVGLSDPDKPLCSFILAGCSGVGKTLMAKEVNKYLFKGQPIIRIDCSEYQQEHEYAKLIGCFIPGSNVSIPGGRTKAIEDIGVGDMVVSFGGSPSTVTQVHEYDFDGEIIAFRVVGDPRAIVCTPQHEIYCWDEVGLRFIWKPAHELIESDWVFFPDEGFKTEGGSPSNEKLWELLGWYMSRGKRLQNNEVRFSLWLYELSAQGRILNAVEELFDMTDAKVILGDDENSIYFDIESPALAAFIDTHLEYPEGRHLPDGWVDNIARPQGIAFFYGLFLLPEGLNKDTDKNATCATRADQLLSQIRLIGSKLGYMPVTVKYQLGGGNFMFKADLRWPHLWGLVSEYNGSLAENCSQCSGYHKLDAGSMLQVQRVGKAIYKGKVHDLSIDGEPSYLVNQLLVHNSPPGYKDSDRDGHLTGKLKSNPEAVVLVDEIEKADKRLFDLFLQILGEGRLTDNKGRVIDCSKAAFLFTTNLGNDYITNKAIGFNDKEDRKLTEKHVDLTEYQKYISKKVTEHFRLELIGRIDDILVFNRLCYEDYLKIVDLEICKIASRLKLVGDFGVKVTLRAKRKIIELGASDTWGARRISDVLRNELEDAIADYLLTHNVKKGMFHLGWIKDKGFQLELKKQGGKKDVEKQKSK